MRYCKLCQEYTLEEQCLKCNGQTINPNPARFSPDDKYGEYRRKLKNISR